MKGWYTSDRSTANFLKRTISTFASTSVEFELCNLGIYPLTVMGVLKKNF